MADPPDRGTCFTLWSWKAGWLDRRAETSMLFAVATVGAEDIAVQPTVMELRALTKLTREGCVLRAHPSGTFTLKRPPEERNVTYTVLSGMSPGGLLSAGTGFCEGTGLFIGDDDAPGKAPDELGLVGGAAAPDEWAHALSTRATTAGAAPRRRSEERR